MKNIMVHAEAATRSTLPIEEINPSDPEIFYEGMHDAVFDRLRDESPVHYCPRSEFGPYWSITKYADIVDIESRHAEFSSRNGFTIADGPPDTPHRSFITMDPPEHKAARLAVTPIASQSSLSDLSSAISLYIKSTLDELPIDRPFDFVSLVSSEITIKVLALMMGVPLEKRHDLLRWSHIASTVPRPGEDIHSIEEYYLRLRECYEYFFEQTQLQSMEDQRRTFVSMLVNSPHTRHMSYDEIFLNLLLLLLAGNDTTRHSLTGGALFLDNHPLQRDLFYSDQNNMLSGISEIIRYQTPVAHMRRTATQDILFKGNSIKKGDKVILWYVSGNRDPDAIDSPNEFIINRTNHDHHLAFGSGVHRCIGKNIAILQMKLFWEEIIRRELVVKVVAQPERVRSNIVNGYSALMVELKRM